jgi:hypothetical protein
LEQKEQSKMSEQEKALHEISYLQPERTDRKPVPETVALRPESRTALAEILMRRREEQASAEDVVATALEVFNVITDHLSQKDSKVILHKAGEGLKTLHINSLNTTRTVYRSIKPPKMTW